MKRTIAEIIAAVFLAVIEIFKIAALVYIIHYISS